MRPCQGRDNGAIPFTRSISGRSSPAERSLDMREAGRAALSAPTIFEGIAQPVRADASHASGRRRESFCPHHFGPCGVVQPTRLPLKQEITGAKPVRDANFHAPKAFPAMPSLGKRVSSVQLRVGAPISKRPQSNQRSGRRHKPARPGAAPGTATISPPCSSLRISFVKKSCRSNTGWRIHFILLA